MTSAYSFPAVPAPLGSTSASARARSSDTSLASLPTRTPDTPDPGFGELTANDIFTMLEDRRSFYSNLHSEMDIDEDFLRMASTWGEGAGLAAKYLTGFPKGFVPKVVPLALWGVTSGVNSVFSGETPSVSVSVPARVHNDTALKQKHEDTIKRWDTKFLIRTDYSSTDSVWRDFGTKAIALGMGVILYPPDYFSYPAAPLKPGISPRSLAEREEWASYERAREAAWPWHGIRSVHPRLCFPDPDGEPPADLIIEEKVSKAAMIRAYPGLRDRLGWDSSSIGAGSSHARSESSRTSLMVTYISDRHYACFVDRIPVLTKDDGANEEGICPNPVGRAWFKVAAGGFGDTDRDARPEHRFKGVIRDNRDIILRVLTALNIVEAIGMLAAFPPLSVTAPTLDEAEDVAERFRYGPGQILPTTNQVSIAPVQAHQVPDAIWRELDQARHDYQAAFAADPLTGNFQDEAASKLKTRLEQAKARYRPAKHNLQQAGAMMLMDIHRQIVDLGGPVTVLGETLSPNDLPDGVLLEIEFAPPTDEAKMQRLQDGAVRQKMGIISQRELMTDYGDVDDPDQMMIQIDGEKLAAQPPIQEAMTRIAVELLSQQLRQQHPDLAAALGPEQTMPQAGGTGPGQAPQPGAQPSQAPNVGPEQGQPGPAQEAAPPQNVPALQVAPGGQVMPGQQPPPTG